MAKVCEVCSKGPQVGNSVSHSNKKTLRRFNPNLFKKRIFDPATGKTELTKLCASCHRTSAKSA